MKVIDYEKGILIVGDVAPHKAFFEQEPTCVYKDNWSIPGLEAREAGYKCSIKNEPKIYKYVRKANEEPLTDGSIAYWVKYGFPLFLEDLDSERRGIPTARRAHTKLAISGDPFGTYKQEMLGVDDACRYSQSNNAYICPKTALKKARRAVAQVNRNFFLSHTLDGDSYSEEDSEESSKSEEVPQIYTLKELLAMDSAAIYNWLEENDLTPRRLPSERRLQLYAELNENNQLDPVLGIILTSEDYKEALTLPIGDITKMLDKYFKRYIVVSIKEAQIIAAGLVQDDDRVETCSRSNFPSYFSTIRTYSIKQQEY